MFFTKKKALRIELAVEMAMATMLQRIDALAHAQGFSWTGSGYARLDSIKRFETEWKTKEVFPKPKGQRTHRVAEWRKLAPIRKGHRIDLSALTPEQKLERKRALWRKSNKARWARRHPKDAGEYEVMKARAVATTVQPSTRPVRITKNMRDRARSRANYELKMAALGRTVKHRTPDPIPASLYGPPAEPTRKAVAATGTMEITKAGKPRVRPDLSALSPEDRKARKAAQKALANARYIARKRSEAGVILRESLPEEKRQPELGIAREILSTDYPPLPSKKERESYGHKLSKDFYDRLHDLAVNESIDVTEDVAAAQITVSKLRQRLYRTKYDFPKLHGRDYYALSDLGRIRVKRLA